MMVGVTESLKLLERVQDDRVDVNNAGEAPMKQIEIGAKKLSHQFINLTEVPVTLFAGNDSFIVAADEEVGFNINPARHTSTSKKKDPGI